MGTNLADLNEQLLLLIAQHLIVSSSVRPSKDRSPGSSATKSGANRDLFPHPAQSSALHSRVNINSLLNSNAEQNRQDTRKPVASVKVSTQSRPRPVYLLPLLLTCRRIYAALSVEGNPTLYKWLYEITFDTAAVKRRWNRSFIPSWHFQESQGSPSGSDDTYRESKRRRSENAHTSQSRITGTASSTINLDYDNNHLLLAEEYRDRMKMFRRLKAWKHRRNEDLGDGGHSRVTEEEEDMQTVHDLWMMWWMVTEHDEKNIPLLRELTCLEQCIKSLYQKVYLSDVLSPGFPPSTITKALLAWLALRLGMTTIFEDTPEQVDEKAFALTPFALASFKYPLYIAPWTFRVLPLTKVAESEEELRLLCKPNAFMPDLTPKELGVPVKRFGREWNVLPNFYADAASLIFNGVLDRHPHLVTLGKRPGTPSYHAVFPHENRPIPKPHMASNLRGSEASTPRLDERADESQSFFVPRPGLASVRQLTSLEYDQDFKRAMACASPITSPGLPPLFYRRKIEGTWKGAYIFFDFEAYRRVLGGSLRSLYEGAYGHQDCEWIISESVINVKHDRVGGTGSFLSAGFRIDQTAEEATAEARLSPEERGWEPCVDENAPDKPGWTKEILLTGQARHSWGTSEIYGRVRMWDGLVIMRQDFSHRPVGRWLYTGYIHAGGLMVGRWRDTFTPENQRGYENAFHLHKVSDSADLPIRWTESDYRRYDVPPLSSSSSSRGLSSSAASGREMSTKPYSPGERASSQASSRSYISNTSPQLQTSDMSILPPIRPQTVRNATILPGIVVDSQSHARPSLPSVRDSFDRESTPS